jgi:hypothetical protein
MNVHERTEELISAALTGDISEVEQAQLSAHLRDCPECRATQAAFAEQRRLVGGLRHVQPPRDLGARVRTGIAAGRHPDLPWWRRPAGIFAGVAGGAAVVAGALLAVVVMNAAPDGQVGQTVPPTPDASAEATAGPAESPMATIAPPSATPMVNQTPDPSMAATPPPDPLAQSGYFEFGFVDVADPSQGQELQLRDADTGAAVITLLPPAPDDPIGSPVGALSSPDGEWVAVRLLLEGKGTEQLYAMRPADGTVVALGETQPDPNGFADRFSWSPDSRYLAYTLIDPEQMTADIWLFDRQTDAPTRLTATGDAYSAGFDPSSVQVSPEEAGLWVSVAAETPRTYILAIPADNLPITELAPTGPIAGGISDGIFLPLVSPDGEQVIFWRGTMSRNDQGMWSFARGGMLHLGGPTDDGGVDFGGGQLFPDLVPVTSGQGFSGAHVAWAPDSDAYAVWGAAWTGTSQPAGFPDPDRVYLGHVSNGQGITPAQALDSGDLGDAEGQIRDVAIAADGAHLWVTVSRPVAGVLAQPRADLFYVRRNTGTTPDEVDAIGDRTRWAGPAVYLPED